MKPTPQFIELLSDVANNDQPDGNRILEALPPEDGYTLHQKGRKVEYMFSWPDTKFVVVKHMEFLNRKNPEKGFEVDIYECGVLFLTHRDHTMKYVFNPEKFKTFDSEIPMESRIKSIIQRLFADNIKYDIIEASIKPSWLPFHHAVVEEILVRENSDDFREISAYALGMVEEGVRRGLYNR